MRSLLLVLWGQDCSSIFKLPFWTRFPWFWGWRKFWFLELWPSPGTGRSWSSAHSPFSWCWWSYFCLRRTSFQSRFCRVQGSASWPCWCIDRMYSMDQTHSENQSWRPWVIKEVPGSFRKFWRRRCPCTSWNYFFWWGGCWRWRAFPGSTRVRWRCCLLFPCGRS